VLQRAVKMRQRGARLIDIAETMNEARISTPAGRERWLPIHVSRLLKTRGAQEAWDRLDGDDQP
jgi:hypothetical protein